MNATEQARFYKLYNLDLRTLKLRGMSDKTIDSYARAVRRVSRHFDCCPDQLTTVQLRNVGSQAINAAALILLITLGFSLPVNTDGVVFFVIGNGLYAVVLCDTAVFSRSRPMRSRIFA